jgi:hypothetical protein
MKCLPKGTVIGVYGIASLLMLLVHKLLSHSAMMQNQARSIQLSAAQQLQHMQPAELMRPLVLYLQYLLIISSMNAEWPVPLAHSFHALAAAFAPASAQFLGVECLFSADGSIPLSMKVVLFNLFAPLALLGVALVIEVTCFLRARHGKRTAAAARRVGLGPRIACSCMVAVLLYLPGIARTTFTIMACVRVDAPVEVPFAATAVGRFWLLDMQEQCLDTSGSTYHRRWALSLGIPLLLLVCGVLPAVVFLVVLLNSKRLNHMRFKHMFGFLYKSYRSCCCFWEGVVTCQCLVLVAISVFGYTLGPFHQALVMTAALAFIGLLLLACKPYSVQHAGRVHLQSIGCLMLTSFSALSFVAQGCIAASTSSVVGLVLAAVALGVNAVFVASVVWQLLQLVQWRRVYGVMLQVVTCNCRRHLQDCPALHAGERIPTRKDVAAHSTTSSACP